MKRKILITGGAGFIGFHLAKDLSNDTSNMITIVDNLTRGRMDADLKELTSRSNVNFLNCDLANSAELDSIEDSYDNIFHFAAMVGVKHCTNNPEEVLITNGLSSINILNMAKRLKTAKLLFSSTSEVYASCHELGILKVPTDETTPVAISDIINPRFSYAASKIFGEQLFYFSSIKHGFPCNIVRFHNIYGPRMGYAHVIPEIIKRAKIGESPFRIYGYDQTRAFCYVDDAIMALKMLMFSDVKGEIIHVGNDKEEINIKKLVFEIFKILNIMPETVCEPAPVGSVARRCPDISKLRKLTGFSPKISLSEGLIKTCDWYLNELSKNQPWE